MKRSETAKYLVAALMPLVIQFAPVAGQCDEVVLANGDRLTGTIVDSLEGTLTLKTSYSEPIHLQANQIKSITSDSAVEVKTTGGEILKGKLSSTGDGNLQVGPVDGRSAATVPLQQVAALNAPAVAWHGSVTAGGTMQSGNTDKSSSAISAEGIRRSEMDRITLRGLYNSGKDDGVRTAENFYGELKYDYFFTKKWYAYLGTDMLIDQFKDLNLRYSIGPGVGYQVWEEEKMALGLEAGVAYFNEDHDIGEDNSWMAAKLGADFRYLLWKNLQFSDRLAVYPSLESLSDFQVRNEAGLSTTLAGNWSLNFLNIYEYTSTPTPGFKKNDVTWVVGLQYGF